MGLSRFADNDLGPPSLKGFESADCVLHRLAEELYSIVYPAISTWGVIRGLMAGNETGWSLPLLSDFHEGLSSPKREVREVLSEAMPNVSRSLSVPRVNKSWKAMSYFSKVDQDDIDRMRSQYQISDDIVLRVPDSDERACCPKFDDVAFYEADFQVGLRFPL